MLFNSYVFITLFLPATLLVYYGLRRFGRPEVPLVWLVLASVFFYGWWNPSYVGLILASIALNYVVGVYLSCEGYPRARRLLLWLGVSANLATLGYYKYANFFIEQVAGLLDTPAPVLDVALPLAISFFTFQQIAYLVDAYRGETREYNFIHYCLFVTFFPQLIAGPIVHHKEMIPQFLRPGLVRLSQINLAVGITIFVIGLFKKVVIADGFAPLATPVFADADAGMHIGFVRAWTGALAYTFQLYFDFSGYSDMAVGLARMFGIRLPINFYSPYKALNIADFWRRWHITLSRFLRDYVYIPLGGNRKGQSRRYLNLLVTMLLGGLWHGASWNFVLWGGMHGLYLMVVHLWHRVRRWLGYDPGRSSWGGRFAARMLTFIAVVVAWVLFRAETLDGAYAMLYAMFGGDGVALDGKIKWPRFIVAAVIIWLLPNTYQFMRRFRPALGAAVPCDGMLCRKHMLWAPSLTWNLVLVIMAVSSFFLIARASEFLYFRF